MRESSLGLSGISAASDGSACTRTFCGWAATSWIDDAMTSGVAWRRPLRRARRPALRRWPGAPTRPPAGLLSRCVNEPLVSMRTAPVAASMGPQHRCAFSNLGPTVLKAGREAAASPPAPVPPKNAVPGRHVAFRGAVQVESRAPDRLRVELRAAATRPRRDRAGPVRNVASSRGPGVSVRGLELLIVEVAARTEAVVRTRARAAQCWTSRSSSESRPPGPKRSGRRHPGRIGRAGRRRRLGHRGPHR